jgi:hypothetical protein
LSFRKGVPGPTNPCPPSSSIWISSTALSSLPSPPAPSCPIPPPPPPTSRAAKLDQGLLAEMTGSSSSTCSTSCREAPDTWKLDEQDSFAPTGNSLRLPALKHHLAGKERTTAWCDRAWKSPCFDKHSQHPTHYRPLASRHGG